MRVHSAQNNLLQGFIGTSNGERPNVWQLVRFTFGSCQDHRISDDLVPFAHTYWITTVQTPYEPINHSMFAGYGHGMIQWSTYEFIKKILQDLYLCVASIFIFLNTICSCLSFLFWENCKLYWISIAHQEFVYKTHLVSYDEIHNYSEPRLKTPSRHDYLNINHSK